MGILIKETVEQSNLKLSINTSFLIGQEFLDLLRTFVELSKKLNELNERIEHKANSQRKDASKFRELMEEQQKIDERIKETFDLKEQLYKKTLETFDSHAFASFNKEMNQLTQKQSLNNLKIIQATSCFKMNSKTIERTKKEIELVSARIDALKKLIDVEYSKLDWVAAEWARIVLFNSFENIKSQQIKNLLKQVTKNNFELEKTIIKMIEKAGAQIIKNNKYEKQCDLLEQADVLIRINRRIYDLINELIVANDLVDETCPLLQLLVQLLEQVNRYAQHSLYKEKTLNISSSVKRIKDASELNNRIVIKSYRPAFLYKKKIENYSLRFKAINDIIIEVERYLTPTQSKDINTQKVYFL